MPLDTPRTCVCGTSIPPAPATDWDPGCRHCQRLLVARQVDALTADG